MSHISNKKLDKDTARKLERYIISVIRDTGTQTRVNIFDELLTQTEKVMFAKRIGILFLLKKGLSTYKISELLGISPSTAERFENAVDFNKYKHTTDWVWKNNKEGSFDAFMESLVSKTFTGRGRSFKKFIDEF